MRVARMSTVVQMYFAALFGEFTATRSEDTILNITHRKEKAKNNTFQLNFLTSYIIYYIKTKTKRQSIKSIDLSQQFRFDLRTSSVYVAAYMFTCTSKCHQHFRELHTT